MFNKARVINSLGHQAVHSHRPIQQFDALTAVRELFHVSFWMARTYARGAKPDAALAFDADALPKAAPVPKHAVDYLLKLKTDLRARDEKLSEVLYESPFTDVTPRGPDGLFTSPQLGELLSVLERVRASAQAA